MLPCVHSVTHLMHLAPKGKGGGCHNRVSDGDAGSHENSLYICADRISGTFKIGT